MKDLVIGLSLLGMVSACSPAPQAKDNVEEDYCQYVNPFIGNADNGHTFPGACAPFGLIQASPESGVGSWRYCSGYNYDDNFIEGFAQTHLNGTGCPDLGDILLFPFSGDIKDNTYKSEGNYIPVCTSTKLPFVFINFFIKFSCIPIWIEELRYNCSLPQQT